MSLDTRDEPRRLLVVLTDGSNDEGPAPVAQAVAAARKRGIAVVALGLGVTGRDKVNFDQAFAEADARATSDSAHLAAAALRAIADALARHQWGMVTRRAAA
jgi:nitric oxide reductase activation protein